MWFEKLLEFPKKKILVLITIIAFSLFFLLTLLFSPIETELKERTGYGVIEFEFAWNSGTIKKIFKAWGSEGKKQQIFITYMDFLYIIFYSFFMAGCILLVTRKLEGKMQKMGLYMTLAPFLAGIFDVIENINLLLMLGNDTFVDSGCPFIASLCATIKFSFLLISICFFLIALIVMMINKIRK